MNGALRILNHPSSIIKIENKKILKEKGTFDPVGIDGVERAYTLSEWNGIKYSTDYWRMVEPDVYPVDWPTTKEEAIEYIENSLSVSELMGIYPEATRKWVLKPVFEKIGLLRTGYKDGVAGSLGNRKLLKDMGRISVDDARDELYSMIARPFSGIESINIIDEKFTPQEREYLLYRFITDNAIVLGKDAEQKFSVKGDLFDYLVEQLNSDKNGDYKISVVAPPEVLKQSLSELELSYYFSFDNYFSFFFPEGTEDRMLGFRLELSDEKSASIHIQWFYRE